MAAYRRVDDLLTYLLADCLYTGISSGPNARYRVWEAFTLPLPFILRCMYTVCSCKSSCACQLILINENDDDDD